MRNLLSFVCLLFFVSVGYSQVQTGKASFYSKDFAGRLTASGEKFDPAEFTAAHRHLPFGTKVRVTNLANNKSVVVRVNDRGPFVANRMIDVSAAAAKALGFIEEGVTDVTLKVVDDKKSLGKVSAEATAKKTSTKKEKTKKMAVENAGEKSEAKAPVVPKAEPEKVAEGRVKSDLKKEATKQFEEKTLQADKVAKLEQVEPESSAETSGGATVAQIAFYDIEVAQSNPKGYGVQIGSFSEGANLFRLTSRLKKDYKAQVNIAVKLVEETKIYSVIIGEFGSHKEAETFEKKVVEQYPGSFVVNFSESKS